MNNTVMLYYYIIKQFILLCMIFCCCHTHDGAATCPIGVAQTTGEQVYQIVTQMQYLFCDNTYIGQNDLPLIISTPGTYILSEDLVAATTAITINANDVILDLNDHVITQTADIFTVLINGDNTLIRNGSLVTTVSPSLLITNNGSFDGLACKNLSLNGPRGVVTGGIVLNLFFPGHIRDVLIQDCDFAIDVGIAISSTCTAVNINNCQFTCPSFGIILFSNGPGDWIGAGFPSPLREINCSDLDMNCGGSGMLIGAGVSVEHMVIKNITIKNPGTIEQINDPASTNFGLVLSEVSQAIIDNVSIVSTGTIPNDTNGIACIECDNIIIKNSSITGAAAAGIIVVDSSNIIVHNNTVETTIGTGIDIESSDYTIIRNCTVNKSSSDGISLSSTTTASIIYNDVVNGCVGIGINQQGDATNKVLSNLSTNNESADFAGVSSTLIVPDEASLASATYWMDIGI